MKRARDVMEDVVCLSPEDSIFDAAKLFSKSKLSGAPVVENGKLVGIVTTTDIIRFIDIRIGNLPKVHIPSISRVLLAVLRTLTVSKKLDKELKKLMDSKVKSVMSKDAITISPSASFLEIAKIMDEKNIHSIPVVSRRKPIGIITGDLMMKTLIEKSKIKKPTKRKKSS